MILDLFTYLLPKFFFEKTVLQIQLWQWSALFFLAALSYFLAIWISRAVFRALNAFIARNFRHFDRDGLNVARAPTRFGIAFLTFWTQIDWIELSPPVYHRFKLGASVVLIFALTWLAFRIVDLFIEWIDRAIIAKGQIAIRGMLPLSRRAAKCLLALLSFLMLLQNFNINITAVLAGLGVGGIAVALASQKTIENLFGGVMIILDQPVRVGDDCRFMGQSCVVEDIGLRSTKIRTPERTVISIPNSDFSQMQIENLSSRDQFRMNFVVSLNNDSSASQIRDLLDRLRSLLDAHARIDRTQARVRMIALGAYTFDIEVNAYVKTTQNLEFLAIREEVFLQVLDEIQKLGIELAVPTQRTLVAKGHEALS